MLDTGLLAVGILMKLVAALFVLTAVVLILIILVQRGKGGGLSGAFGGGMGGGLMGSKTGDFLTWVTISLVALFLVLAVLMAKYYKPTYGERGKQPAQQSAPAEDASQQSEQTSGQSQMPEESLSPSEDNIEDMNAPTE